MCFSSWPQPPQTRALYERAALLFCAAMLNKRSAEPRDPAAPLLKPYRDMSCEPEPRWIFTKGSESLFFVWVRPALISPQCLNQKKASVMKYTLDRDVLTRVREPAVRMSRTLSVSSRGRRGQRGCACQCLNFPAVSQNRVLVPKFKLIQLNIQCLNIL